VLLLLVGSRIGSYEVISPVGAGGMGEVYRARDARLNRDVAIKVLPGSFADDEDRLRRFEQEAQAAGSLNHPNILVRYDAPNRYCVSADGQRFLVNSPAEEASTTPITVILNWASEFKR
jgi:serine/threonine protein kinase